MEKIKNFAINAFEVTLGVIIFDAVILLAFIQL